MKNTCHGPPPLHDCGRGRRHRPPSLFPFLTYHKIPLMRLDKHSCRISSKIWKAPNLFPFTKFVSLDSEWPKMKQEKEKEYWVTNAARHSMTSSLGSFILWYVVNCFDQKNFFFLFRSLPCWNVQTSEGISLGEYTNLLQLCHKFFVPAYVITMQLQTIV